MNLIKLKKYWKGDKMSDIRTIYLSASDLSDLITKKELILNLSYCDKILLKLDGG
jgi:hypothetical protein